MYHIYIYIYGTRIKKQTKNNNNKEKLKQRKKKKKSFYWNCIKSAFSSFSYLFELDYYNCKLQKQQK